MDRHNHDRHLLAVLTVLSTLVGAVLLSVAMLAAVEAEQAPRDDLQWIERELNGSSRS